MVAAELGVSALEGRVSGSLGLLDTVVAKRNPSALWAHFRVSIISISSDLLQVAMLGRSYPLR